MDGLCAAATADDDVRSIDYLFSDQFIQKQGQCAR